MDGTNIISFILIAIVFVALLGYMIYRGSFVKKLNTALETKDYEKVIELTKNKMCKKTVGEHNCNLYRLKAVYLGRGKEATKKELEEYLESDEEDENKQAVIDVYFHIYLHSNDREFCNYLLKVMDEMGDEMFYRYQKWSYDVMFDKKSEIKDEMEAAIDNHELEGFALGVAAYMTGMCYYYKEDYDIARSYFYTCIDCFLPGNMYIDKAKAKVKELTEIIGDDAKVE